MGHAFEGFPQETFRFLAGLANHNAWFDAHREDHDLFVMAPAMEFVAALGGRARKKLPGIRT